MRARSNIRYNSPPPPYEMYRSRPPSYSMPGQTTNTQEAEVQEETEIPAEPEPDRNLDLVRVLINFAFYCLRTVHVSKDLILYVYVTYQF